MNFIKNQIAKLSMLALLIGLGVTAVGLFTMFQERNVASDPTAMQAAAMQDPGSELIYATVEGGTLDLANTVKSQIKRKRRTLQKVFQGQTYPLLDAGYKPESTMAEIKKLGLFIGLAVAGLIGTILTRRKPDPRMGQVRTHG